MKMQMKDFAMTGVIFLALKQNVPIADTGKRVMCVQLLTTALRGPARPVGKFFGHLSLEEMKQNRANSARFR